jgi:hypothetical protein
MGKSELLRYDIQAEYAGSILYMLCLGLTKISLVTFISTVAVARWPRYVVYSIAGFTTIWTIASVLVQSFQCSLPQPWNYRNQECIDRVRRSSWRCPRVA